MEIRLSLPVLPYFKDFKLLGIHTQSLYQFGDFTCALPKIRRMIADK